MDLAVFSLLSNYAKYPESIQEFFPLVKKYFCIQMLLDIMIENNFFFFFNTKSAYIPCHSLSFFF